MKFSPDKNIQTFARRLRSCCRCGGQESSDDLIAFMVIWKYILKNQRLEGPKMMGLGKGGLWLKIWPFLLSMLDFAHGTHNGKFGKSSTQKCWLKKGDMLVSWRVLFLLENLVVRSPFTRPNAFKGASCCFYTVSIRSLLFFGGGVGGGFSGLKYPSRVLFSTPDPRHPSHKPCRIRAWICT